MIGDDIAAELPRMRQAAESLMMDRCTIREADSWISEELTEGAVVAENVPCRIKVDNTEPRTVVVGGEVTHITRLTVSMPTTYRPLVGHVITVDSSVFDSSLPGRRFDVIDAEYGSQVTSRRMSCQEHK